jgi:hypothetical protein
MGKKIITMICIIIAAAFVLSLSACFGESAPPPEVELKDLYGTWVFEKDNGDVITYTFSDSMKYSLVKKTSVSRENSYGSFSLDGNELTLEPKDVYSKSVHKITSFDGENMVWGDPPVQSVFRKSK